ALNTSGKRSSSRSRASRSAMVSVRSCDSMTQGPAIQRRGSPAPQPVLSLICTRRSPMAALHGRGRGEAPVWSYAQPGQMVCAGPHGPPGGAYVTAFCKRGQRQLTGRRTRNSKAEGRRLPPYRYSFGVQIPDYRGFGTTPGTLGAGPTPPPGPTAGGTG